jgi:allophanate hydrolase
VLQVAAGYDAEDGFSRQPNIKPLPEIAGLRVGVPSDEELTFFGNRSAEQQYRDAIAQLQRLGSAIVPIDFQPFADAAQLLYGGAWVAERLAAIEDFLNPALMNPTVYEIINGGKRYDAVSAFRGMYRLAELRQLADAQWHRMDVLAVPTTGTIYTVAEVEAEPIALNSNLGRYTNFVNLLDLCALSVPSGFQSNGLPTGLTLIAPAWHDVSLCQLGAAYHGDRGGTLGATNVPLSSIPASSIPT